MANIAAVTADGTGINLGTADVDGLRSALRGELIASDPAGYETARRVWNGNVDRRPALIVRATGAADVQQAVSFVRTNHLALALPCGGHSAPGYGTNDG